MFQILEQLVRSTGKLSMTLRMDGEQMVVVAIPQAGDSGKDKEAALNQPLVLTATPAELDAGFVDALTSYTGARRSLGEQVTATTAILQAAEQAQAGKAKRSLSKSSTPALPAPAKKSASTQVSGEDAEDQANDAGADVATESEQTSPAAGASGTGTVSGTDMSHLLDL
jgi:PRTRC genetic system protein E